MAIIKPTKQNKSKSWQGCGKIRTLVHCWQECKMVLPLWKSLVVFWKWNTEFTYDPANSTFGYQLQRSRVTHICTATFLAALFTLAEWWQHPTCPSAEERMKETWALDHGVLFSPKEEGNPHTGRNEDEPWRHCVKGNRPVTKVTPLGWGTKWHQIYRDRK